MSTPASSAHLQALGVVTLNFNNLELSSFRLYSHHLERIKIALNVAWYTYSGLQDSKKTDAIEFIYETYETDPEVIDRVSHFIKFYNRCSNNRNHLFHSRFDYANEDIIHLMSDVNGKWDTFNSIPVSLARIRSIADDMHEGFRYAFDLFAYLQRRDGGLLHIPL
jgi:hypothetical protein